MSAGSMLVAAPERWDEACFAVPAVRALIASGLEIGILCPADQREFWETIPGLTILDIPVKTNARGAAAKISPAWQASLAWEAGLLADSLKLAGILRRLGPNEKKLAKQLTHPVTVSVSPLEHRVRFYLSIIEQLGVHTSSAAFFAPAALGVEAVPGAVLLCPGSDFGPSFEWPLERWMEIGQRLLDANKIVTVASVGGERVTGKALAERLGDQVRFVHVSSLAGVLPVLAVHGLVIAADGSLPHLAAYAGATCVTLFGPNDPAWKRPLGRRHAVLRRHVECAPCLLPKCRLDSRCQNELSVEHVWRAVAEISH